MSEKQRFLETYDQEHARTMRVLRAYPPDQADLRPHPRCNSAREVAWIFVMERGLGAKVMEDAFAKGVPPGKSPEPPASWDTLLGTLDKAHQDFRGLVASLSDARLNESVKFMVGPKQLGDWRRLDFLWFLLHDQIHHRGQLTIYLRLAGGKVPSVYGPSGDEPWT